MISRLCIIGVGLIGGSLAKALKQAEAVGEILGAGRSEGTLRKALELGVIDRYETDLKLAVAEADVVVVAVPLGAVFKVFAAIADHLPPDSVLTDVGSSKTSVVQDARRVFGRTPPNFVPGHPIAGNEQSGVEAAFPELFRNRRIILTPLVETEANAHTMVRRMWEATGAEVTDMGVQHHDEVLAATSHLPHMLAYALVDTLARMDDRVEIFRYAAGGFRDFTRIASSDPQMWHDVCVANREALLAVLESFSDDLTRLTDAIRNTDSDTIMEVFKRAKHARDNLYLR
ncbi:MAG: prephenate dehydrogenase/arogenate dehydrogenase family protein [Candidatus Competibacteraceae bacterium]|nr:prephenate dehydrogenase/arogenate dehydrogenase family protein [Candidatus Competibacteraceae bacterium]